MGKAELLELALRVEKLEGPDPETDRLIHFHMVHPWLAEKAVKWVHAAYEGPTDFLWWDQARLDAKGEGYPDNWEPYTASLDAALSLVPEGWRFILDKRPSAETRSDGYRAVVWLEPIAPYEKMGVWAATPALALTAASLRARATTLPGEEG